MRFKAYRKSLGLNQGGYAERLGVDVSTVCRIEGGQLPRPDLMLRIYRESRGQVEPMDWYPEIIEAGQELGLLPPPDVAAIEREAESLHHRKAVDLEPSPAYNGCC